MGWTVIYIEAGVSYSLGYGEQWWPGNTTIASHSKGRSKRGISSDLRT